MTAPAEPTPGALAPTNPTTPPAPAPTPAPSTTEPTGPDPNDPVDVNALPANVQKLIKELRASEAKTRTSAKDAATAAQQELLAKVAKALGLEEEPASADQLAEQLYAAQEGAWAAAVELQVLRAAPDSATAEALLDSRKFIDTLDELVDLDPRSKEFREGIAAKVQEAVAARTSTTPPAPGAPNGPRPDPTQGPRGTSPAARPTSLGEAVRQHYASR